MTFAHSLGPWQVVGQSDAGRYIKVADANGRTVARVMFNTEAEVAAGAPLTDASNAEMIAAAPAMLAALRELNTAANSGPVLMSDAVATLTRRVLNIAGAL